MTAIERLRDQATIAGTQQKRTDCSTLLAHQAYADPIYRISKLASATRKPLSVSPGANLEEAVTHMLINDYSQLPVMTSDRDVKGVITWTALFSNQYHRGTPVCVGSWKRSEDFRHRHGK